MGIEMAGLADIVRQHASQRPDAAAIVHAGHTTTYAMLDRASNQVANGLIAEGIALQARVAHLDKSSEIFFELLFGTAKANAVMVSVNWRLAPLEVLHIERCPGRNPVRGRGVLSRDREDPERA